MERPVATLKEYDVPAFINIIPFQKLDKDVFCWREVPDWEGLNLLPGEANIMFEGTLYRQIIYRSFVNTGHH